MKGIVILALLSLTAFTSLTGGEITGMVLDARTGKGIPYARVTLYVSLDPNGFDKFRTKQLYVLTGADGHFRVTGLPASWSELRCEKPGYLDDDSQSTGPGQVHLATDDSEAHADLYLIAAGAISGTVVDARGVPLWQADIQVYRQIPGQSTPSVMMSARTDELGGFRISDVRPGRYTLAVSIGFPIVTTRIKPVYYPAADDPQHAEWFEFQSGDERKIEFRLRSFSAK